MFLIFLDLVCDVNNVYNYFNVSLVADTLVERPCLLVPLLETVNTKNVYNGLNLYEYALTVNSKYFKSLLSLDEIKELSDRYSK